MTFGCQWNKETEIVIKCRKFWEKLNRGVSKPGGFPLFSGKVQIVSRTLSGLFLVGALNRPRKRKKGRIGKIPGPSLSKSEKSRKNRERTKKDKKGRTDPDRETPPFETPPFGGPGNCRKLSWHLSCTPLCAECHRALKLPTSHSCAHAGHCDSPGELGRLQGVFHKSVSPIRGAHSAWACQAARSSVQEMGPHSSELAVRFANEKGLPCRTRIWSLWVTFVANCRDVFFVAVPSCRPVLVFADKTPPQIPAVSRSVPRKSRFSAGKCFFSAGKCIYLWESAWEIHFSAGRPSFCSLLWEVKKHECYLFLDEISHPFLNLSSQCFCVLLQALAVFGEPKVHLFLGVPPFLLSTPKDNFSRQNVNWHPPKYKSGRGDFHAILYKSCRQSLLGGRQFAFWRLSLYIFEAEIVLGVCYRKKEDPQKDWHFGFPKVSPRKSFPSPARSVAPQGLLHHVSRSSLPLGRSIRPKQGNMVQGTTKIGIFAFLGGSEMTLGFLFGLVGRLF